MRTFESLQNGHGRRSTVEVDDSALKSECHSFGAIVDTELCHQMLEMDFYGSLSTPNHARDFFIAKSFGNEMKHLNLSLGEIDPRCEFRQPARDCGRYHALPGRSNANRLDELSAQHVLDEISARPGIECSIDVGVSVVCGECEEAGFSVRGEYRHHCADPVHNRHAQVDEGDVGQMRIVERDRFCTIGRLCDNRHVGLV